MSGRIHTLKTDHALYDVIRDGSKNFEIRKDDRHFQTGDSVMLMYGTHDGFAPPPDYHHATMKFDIGFVFRGGQYGIKFGYVGFSLKAPKVDLSEWTVFDGNRIILPPQAQAPYSIGTRDGMISIITNAGILLPYIFHGQAQDASDIAYWKVDK